MQRMYDKVTFGHNKQHKKGLRGPSHSGEQRESDYICSCAHPDHFDQPFPAFGCWIIIILDQH